MPDVNEIFQRVDGWPRYEVSALGNVRRVPGLAFNRRGYPVCIRPNHKGYLRAHLSKKAVFVHKLVALAFVPNPLNLPQINHVDCNKLNNRADNLHRCFSQIREKQFQSSPPWPETGSHGVYDRTAERQRKISEDAIFDIIDRLREGEVTRKSLADKYGVTPQYVGQIWTWYKTFARYQERGKI